jgi:hypothetical protein
MDTYENKTDDRLTIALKNAPNHKQRKGKAMYIRHLQGELLTRSQAIAAKCFECNGDDDTCNVVTCSLLPCCPTANSARASTALLSVILIMKGIWSY